MQTIIPSQLIKIFKLSETRADELVPALAATMEHFDISTLNRRSMFLAQVGHESGKFHYMAENLNYSAKALRAVFGKYFPTQALADQYARKPKLIASRVYANRMGNGNEASQEGWKFRGRGFIQLTGKNNYTAFAKDMGLTIDEAIAYLETLEGAAMSAGWYWGNNNLNAICDTGNLTRLTQRINGGQNGAEDREKLYAKAKDVLG